MNKDNSDLNNNNIISSQIFHETIRGFEELLKRNLWSLKGEMKIKEILEELFQDVPEYLDIVHQKYHDEIDFDDPDRKFISLKEDLIFNSWLLALKIQNLLKNGIVGSDAIDILFPPCLIEFSIEDKEIGLSGKVDRIEIIDGVYYPIKIKTNLPPLKGVWQSDALQIAGYAILMEHEFNKEVHVGFINYMRVGSRKPVLVSSSLREKFTDVFNELTYVLYNDYKPEVVQNINKCRRCDYYALCDYSIK